jgi:hypothetical protein
MPTLAVVRGIRICMYYADHEPAHFHAMAGEHEIIVDLASLSVIDGAAPNRMIRRVRTWAAGHRNELALCWDRCQRGQKPGKIEP